MHGESDMKTQYTALEILITSPVVLNLAAISGTAGKNANPERGERNPDDAAITTHKFFLDSENRVKLALLEIDSRVFVFAASTPAAFSRSSDFCADCDAYGGSECSSETSLIVEAEARRDWILEICRDTASSATLLSSMGIASW